MIIYGIKYKACYGRDVVCRDLMQSNQFFSVIISAKVVDDILNMAA
jgi:hypothetical protein